MARCKITLSVFDKLKLKLYARYIRKKALAYLENTKAYKFRDYIEDIEEIMNSKVLEMPWNKKFRERFGPEFEYNDLKSMGVTLTWPDIKPPGAVTRSVTTGTTRRKTIYYTKFDLEALWLVNIKYAWKTGIMPAKTSLFVSSGFDVDCRPYTSTLLGETVGYFLGIKNMHFIYDEIDNRKIRRFVAKYGAFDRLLIFVTYLYSFKFYVNFEGLVHSNSAYVHTGDILNNNIFSVIKELFTKNDIDRFKVINLYGASECGMIAHKELLMSSWDDNIQDLALIPDRVLFTFRSYDKETGELGQEILLIDEIKEGSYYNILITPVKSVFVPNYDLNDIVYVVKKAPDELILRVVGRYGKKFKFEWKGKYVEGVEPAVVEFSGLSVISNSLLNKCAQQQVGLCESVFVLLIVFVA